METTLNEVEEKNTGALYLWISSNSVRCEKDQTVPIKLERSESYKRANLEVKQQILFFWLPTWSGGLEFWQRGPAIELIERRQWVVKKWLVFTRFNQILHWVDNDNLYTRSNWKREILYCMAIACTVHLCWMQKSAMRIWPLPWLGVLLRQMMKSQHCCSMRHEAWKWRITLWADFEVSAQTDCIRAPPDWQRHLSSRERWMEALG